MAAAEPALWRRAIPVIVATIAIVLLVALLAYLADVVILVFAGTLIALLVRAPTDWLARHTPLNETLSLVLVLVCTAALLGAAGWLFGHALADQLGSLFSSLPQIVQKLRQKFSSYEWILGPLAPADLVEGHSSAFLGGGLGVLAATFGAAANLGIVLFTALFLAFQPGLYLEGTLRLVPRERRAHAREVLVAIGHTLRWWLVGQAITMAAVGVLWGVGLWLLGVPMAFALALLAGLLEFIPYIGPILSAIPAVLVALAQSPQLALYTLGLYAAIHMIEGNVLQPIVQRKTVYLPPAVVLVAQVMLYILVGLLGAMFATPVAAALMVAVRKLYVEDLLGERPAPR